MPHKLCKRKRRGKTYFYAEISGRQVGLGTDAKQAEAEWHRLVNEEAEKQKLGISAQPAPAVEQGLTVRSVIAQFLTWSAENHSEGTYTFYKRALVGVAEKPRSFVSFDDYLQASGNAELDVADFGAVHVERWINKHFKCKGANYIHNLIRAVQQAFNWAIAKRPDLLRQIKRNDTFDAKPRFGIEKPGCTPRKVYITDAQWRMIIDTVTDEPFLDLITVLKETGMRPIEIRTAEKKHLDMAAKQLYFEDPPKKVRGKKRPRVVLLTDTAFAICQRLALKHPTGPLFRNVDGQPWNKDAINCRWHRLNKKLGLKLCAVAIRHTWCTNMLKSKADPLTVAAMMGHSNGQMVMNVYSQLDECKDHWREALKAMG